MTQAPVLFKDIQAYYLDHNQGQVRDLSQGGVALATNHPLTMGSTYAFHLSNARMSLLVEGEVIRCELGGLDASKPVYLSGVRFLFPPRSPRSRSLAIDERSGARRTSRWWSTSRIECSD